MSGERYPKISEIGDFGNKLLSPKSKEWKKKVDVVSLQKANHLSVSDTPSTNNNTINENREVTENFEDEDLEMNEILNSLLADSEKEEVKIEDSDRKVEGLKVDLLDHQVRGLKFMLEKEQQFNKAKESGKYNYGGILADDMGLGKTIQMIALMLSHRPNEMTHLNGENKSGTTLVVCPASLMVQWQKEITNKSGQLTSWIHHGSQKVKNVKKLHEYNVIITSYETLSAEHKKGNSILFDQNWLFFRVILDEAHVIRNIETKVNKACTAVRSNRRWCLSGTPLQNKIDDLYGLWRFLAVNEYENFDLWKRNISGLLGVSDTQSRGMGLRRIRNLLKIYMLRRTKSVIRDILNTKKKMITEILTFTEWEKIFYQKLVDKLVDNLIAEGIAVNNNNKVILSSKDGKKIQSAGFGFLIRLRQVCCNWKILVDAIHFHEAKELESIIDAFENIKKEEKKNKEFNILFEQLKIDDHEKEKLNDNNKVQLDNEPIKIQRVINILLQDKKENKKRKTIIFSDFTQPFVYLSKALDANNIQYLQYDGTLSRDLKADVLDIMENDPSKQVLLCSLKCGAYGLNLTFCSRVIIYAPFWNPSVIDQAIDRVYRIGQKEDITVHELYIDDTIEMLIKETCERKRKLIKSVIENDVDATKNFVGAGLNNIFATYNKMKKEA
ncbi:hypothetical protein DAMA08_027760 [Martiniozyma asiatica (nom. inval.)]|nr:hypothetical protein DAMA08_027760 [Martiniozyma asiatica]